MGFQILNDIFVGIFVQGPAIVEFLRSCGVTDPESWSSEVYPESFDWAAREEGPDVETAYTEAMKGFKFVFNRGYQGSHRDWAAEGAYLARGGLKGVSIGVGSCSSLHLLDAPDVCLTVPPKLCEALRLTSDTLKLVQIMECGDCDNRAEA